MISCFFSLFSFISKTWSLAASDCCLAKVADTKSHRDQGLSMKSERFKTTHSRNVAEGDDGSVKICHRRGTKQHRFLDAHCTFLLERQFRRMENVCNYLCNWECHWGRRHWNPRHRRPLLGDTTRVSVVRTKNTNIYWLKYIYGGLIITLHSPLFSVFSLICCHNSSKLQRAFNLK